MKKVLIVVLICFIFASTLYAESGFEGRPITDNVWVPTGYTLHKGEFIVGIGPIGVGITDNVQVGTNILLWLFQIYNANLKVNVMQSSSMAFAVGLDYTRFNLSSLFSDDDETDFNVISPFVSLSTKMGTNTDVHFAGRYSYISSDEDIDEFESGSSTSGTTVLAGIEHSMSHKTKLLLDVGYDFTFEGLRIGGGVLFGWTKFRLKLGVGYYGPKDSDAFTIPVIGLWWRFKG